MPHQCLIYLFLYLRNPFMPLQTHSPSNTLKWGCWLHVTKGNKHVNMEYPFLTCVCCLRSFHEIITAPRAWLRSSLWLCLPCTRAVVLAAAGPWKHKTGMLSPSVSVTCSGPSQEHLRKCELSRYPCLVDLAGCSCRSSVPTYSQLPT